MDMPLVVRRLTHPPATSTQTFLWVLRHFPFTGGASVESLLGFFEAAIVACDGGHAAAKRDAIRLLSGVVAQRGRVMHGFPRLDFDQVLYQLTLRVMEPRLVDQGGYGLCGPAAFAVLLAKTDPVAYVRAAVELLTLGRTRIRGLEVAPNEGIRLHCPATTPHADWLVLASIRSSSDVISETMDSGKYGGTNYGQMVQWLKASGYGVVVGAYSAHLTGTLATISSLPVIRSLDAWACCEFHPQRPSFLNGIGLTQLTNQQINLFLADRFVRNHWKVLLLVSEKYTQTSGDTDPIERALEPMRRIGAPQSSLESMRRNLIGQMVGTETNHWILVKELHLSDDMVRITRYSWGKKDTTAPIPRDLFYTIYGGFVAVSTMDVHAAVAAWRW